MRIGELKPLYRRFEFVPKDWLGGKPSDAHYDTLIDEPSALYDAETGRLLMVYLPYDLIRAEQLLNELTSEEVSYTVVPRSQLGMGTYSFMFGGLPKSRLRSRACSVSRSNPHLLPLLREITQDLEALYEQLAPDYFAEHAEYASKVHHAYRLGRVFTTGIVNNNCAIPYHFDKGNLHGAWSAMIYLTRFIAGGHTVFPEFKVAFAAQHGYAAFFAGSVYLHGVTPFTRLNDRAHRFTVVWYTRKELWKCEAPPHEYEAYKRWRTEYEQRVAREGRRIFATARKRGRTS